MSALNQDTVRPAAAGYGKPCEHCGMGDLESWSQLAQDSYSLGFVAGYAQGWAEADAKLVGALTDALGRPDETDYGQALKAHERMSDQRARRAEADRAASLPRPGDFRGGVPLPPENPQTSLEQYRAWCRRLVAEELARDPDQSDWTIALRLGVNHELVGGVRRQQHRRAA